MTRATLDFPQLSGFHHLLRISFPDVLPIAAYSRSGKLLAIAAKHYVYLIDALNIQDSQKWKALRFENDVTALCFLWNKEEQLVVAHDRQLTLINTNSCQVVEALHIMLEHIERVDVCSESRIFFVTQDSTLQIYRRGRQNTFEIEMLKLLGFGVRKRVVAIADGVGPEMVDIKFVSYMDRPKAVRCIEVKERASAAEFEGDIVVLWGGTELLIFSLSEEVRIKRVHFEYQLLSVEILAGEAYVAVSGATGKIVGIEANAKASQWVVLANEEGRHVEAVKGNPRWGALAACERGGVVIWG